MKKEFLLNTIVKKTRQPEAKRGSCRNTRPAGFVYELSCVGLWNMGTALQPFSMLAVWILL